MKRPDEQRISKPLGFKYVNLSFLLLFLIALSLGGIAGVFTTKTSSGLMIGALFPIVAVIFGFLTFPPLLQQREVWLGQRNLRLRDLSAEAVVPYDAIASIRQQTMSKTRDVVVKLAHDTPFGRRFTFLPRKRKIGWPFSRGEDDLVIELRRRIEEAKASGQKPAEPTALALRSIMADAELDGPF